MNLFSPKMKLRVNRLSWIIILHFLVSYVTFFFEFGHTPFFWWVVKLFLLPVFFYYFFSALKNLYYSYWTYTFILFTHHLTGIVQSLFYYDAQLLLVLYLIQLSIMILLSVYLFGPPYFPLVDWWEFDFRYRSDLHVMATYHDPQQGGAKVIEGRVTDMSRGALGIAFFEHLPLGETIEICAVKYPELKMKIELHTKRNSFIGRETLYGASFVDRSLFHSKDRLTFIGNWKKMKRDKLRKKYSEAQLES